MKARPRAGSKKSVAIRAPLHLGYLLMNCGFLRWIVCEEWFLTQVKEDLDPHNLQGDRRNKTAPNGGSWGEIYSWEEFVPQIPILNRLLVWCWYFQRGGYCVGFHPLMQKPIIPPLASFSNLGLADGLSLPELAHTGKLISLAIWDTYVLYFGAHN